ncbi:MAG: phosphoglycerate dehydrogenase [Acidobacteriota bacterium]
MKILITDPLSREGLDHLGRQEDFEVVFSPGISSQRLLDEIREADALIVRGKTRVTPELIAAADRLRVIGRAGAGVDNIDIEAATRKGIVVMNTPGGNSVSVAEHAFALLIALARKVAGADASLRAGHWNKSAFLGQELLKKTLGIVGLGKIGSVLARRAKGFDMTVLAYDPFVSNEYALGLGVQLSSLEDLLRQSDFVSLHLPLNDQTRALIGRSELSRMKPGAFLINTARGDLVVESELAEALERGLLAGAGLDVFQNEPEISPRLLRSEKVTLTPHIAGSTFEAQAKVGYGIAVQVTDYLRQEVILNAVNFPSLPPGELARMLPCLQLGEKLGSFIGQIASLRLEEIGLRYYGDLTEVDYRPITNYALKAVLQPVLSETINEVSARSLARERGISVIETASGRQRSYSNLISIQLRSSTRVEWIEGALLHQGRFWLVSVDGIPVETQLGSTMLFIRNEDRPGVIGQVGTILGRNSINIASFVLGRDRERPGAVGVVNTDSPIPQPVLAEIRKVPPVHFARVVSL